MVHFLVKKDSNSSLPNVLMFWFCISKQSKVTAMQIQGLPIHQKNTEQVLLSG